MYILNTYMPNTLGYVHFHKNFMHNKIKFYKCISPACFCLRREFYS